MCYVLLYCISCVFNKYNITDIQDVNARKVGREVIF